ncbi:oxygenase MpaB family protein [Antrihabitans sp. YC2-6]|uniref:oxygenase MpaB family protein n=1 Tax=Antrihabitans sp. YC2-6 TaxID=2799498 RepID=UPI0018F41864|nr:oxygenase MpaB family protein [Antrihabitans sp. YC2-6]MBJ8346175.1 DUF2236 domain-containing protein [Antrihabitans sp. YC2-6]
MAAPVQVVPDASTHVDFQIADYVYGITAFLGGTANVIMQLSQAPVGYGVVESTVDSGKVTKHPIKRMRTTLTYLAVALMGSEEERIRYREAVNVSHRPVHSGPDSPVKYNAFDKKLQLWVAMCLYRGVVDTLEAMDGPLDDATADALYAHCERLGTTLQVPAYMWPPNRAAFDVAWERSLDEVSIDPTVRKYLTALMTLEFMPWPIHKLFGKPQTFIVTGFLPQRFRDEMHLTFSESDQRRFDRLLRVIGAVNRRLPGPLRRFPFNLYLTDLRLRIRFDRALV